jgi:ribonuclease HI
VKRAAAIKRIDEFKADVTIYTDGSASAGCRKGGSAVVVTTGEAELPEQIEVIRRKGASHTSSYEEECQAMEDTAKWVTQEASGLEKVLVCTDSQSMCRALEEGSAELEELSKLINACPTKIIIQWIPGHSNIPGNELADAEAKKATEEAGPGRPISMNSMKTVIKEIVKDGAIEHERTREVYTRKSKKKDQLLKTRSDQVLLARLRSGHHFGFMTYKHRLNSEEDPTCPRCRDADILGTMQKPLCLDNVEHWLECSSTEEQRMRIFGRIDVGLGVLTDDPRGSVALARRTLRGTGWEGIHTPH